MSTHLTMIARGNVESLREHATAAEAVDHVMREAHVTMRTAERARTLTGPLLLVAPATATAIEIRRL